MPLSDHEVDPGRYVADDDDTRFGVIDVVQGSLGPILLLCDDDGDIVLKHRATVVDTFSATEAPEPPEVQQQATDADRIAQLEALVARLAEGDNTVKPAATQEAKAEVTDVQPETKAKPAAKPSAKRAARSRAKK